MFISKQHFIIISTSLIILAVFFGINTYLDDRDQVLEQDELNEYIITYLDTYISIIEPPSNLTREEIEYFKFLKGYPYSAVGVISNSHGAAIQFIPKSIEPYRLDLINENIEEILFPRMPDDAPDMWKIGFAIGGKQYASNTSFSNMGIYVGKNGTFIFDGVVIISDTSIYRKGNIELDGVLIDDGYNVIAKGSNLKKDWSIKKAEQDAKDAFFRELSLVILKDSKLKGLGILEITSLIEDYQEKEKIGFYEKNPKEKIKDREIIFTTADKYGLHYGSFQETLTELDDDSFYSNVLECIAKIGNLFTGITIITICVVVIIIFKNKIKGKKSIYQSLRDEIKNIEIIKRINKETKQK